MDFVDNVPNAIKLIIALNHVLQPVLLKVGLLQPGLQISQGVLLLLTALNQLLKLQAHPGQITPQLTNHPFVFLALLLEPLVILHNEPVLLLLLLKVPQPRFISLVLNIEPF